MSNTSIITQTISIIVLYIIEILEKLNYYNFLIILLLYLIIIVIYNIKTKDNNSTKDFKYYFETGNIFIDMMTSFLLLLSLLYISFVSINDIPCFKNVYR